jgi:hypothetical protein
MQKWLQLLCILHFALCIAGCSIPNLEPQSCIDSRTAVREFYSYHFGNGLGFSDEDLDKRKQFLTPEYFKWMRFPPRDRPPGMDPFTRTFNDPPKAFRVGECKEIAPGKADFQVLLFWRDDARSEQREIHVEVVNQNDRWLINRVADQLPGNVNR